MSPIDSLRKEHSLHIREYCTLMSDKAIYIYMNKTYSPLYRIHMINLSLISVVLSFLSGQILLWAISTN